MRTSSSLSERLVDLSNMLEGLRVASRPHEITPKAWEAFHEELDRCTQLAIDMEMAQAAGNERPAPPSVHPMSPLRNCAPIRDNVIRAAFPNAATAACDNVERSLAAIRRMTQDAKSGEFGAFVKDFYNREKTGPDNGGDAA